MLCFCEAREAAARRQVAVRQEQLARDETSAYFAAKHWTNVFKPPYDDDCEKGLQTEGNHLQPVKQAKVMQMNRLLLHAAADTFQVSFLLPGSLNYSQFYS